MVSPVIYNGHFPEAHIASRNSKIFCIVFYFSQTSRALFLIFGVSIVVNVFVLCQQRDFVKDVGSSILAEVLVGRGCASSTELSHLCILCLLDPFKHNHTVIKGRFLVQVGAKWAG